MKTFTVLFLFSLLFALATSSLLKVSQPKPPKCVRICVADFNSCSQAYPLDKNPKQYKNCERVRTQCCRKRNCNNEC